MAQNTQTIKKQFPVTGMTCAGCAASVENVLKKTHGVQEAVVNLANHSTTIEMLPSTEAIQLQKALQAVGYDLIIDEENANEEQQAYQKNQYEQLKTQTLGAALLTFPIFILGMFFMHWLPGRWISLALSFPVLFWFGRHFYVNAWKQARHRSVNMDTLVTLSTSIAFLFSTFNTLFPEFWTSRGLEVHVYFEAATVIITFVLFGKLLEEKARSKTSSAIKKLMGLQPKTVTVFNNGVEVQKAIADLEPGALIRVKPGQSIPVDGIIIEGDSFVEESMLTGEPMPTAKGKGAQVFAGTINQNGSFLFEAEKMGGETLLGQIIQKVQEAQGSKAPVQLLVDKIAAVFVPVVLLISLLTFGTWMLLGGEDGLTHALLTSVAVLVIACPCALGLATPTAIMVGVGLGAEHNILIKDAESLEIGYRVNAIVLDKTGTLTTGKPTVSEVVWAHQEEIESMAAVLLAMEMQSSHPLADAVVTRFEKEIEPAKLLGSEAVPGKGIRAADRKGKSYFAGNYAWVLEQQVSISNSLLEVYERLRSEGVTTVCFANGTEVLAVLGITDPLKEGSKEAIAGLHQMGIETYLLSGDSQEAANKVAEDVGIKTSWGSQMPDDKAAFIKELQAKGKTVAMVGDGINDSQALATADVSIAMGQGTDIAMDVAKITLLTSDLRSIPKAFQLSKRTVIGIRQNLFWAFIYNIVGIPIAAGALYSVNGFLLDPMIAGAAMAFSSVSVMANSLRLRMIKL